MGTGGSPAFDHRSCDESIFQIEDIAFLLYVFDAVRPYAPDQFHRFGGRDPEFHQQFCRDGAGAAMPGDTVQRDFSSILKDAADIVAHMLPARFPCGVGYASVRDRHFYVPDARRNPPGKPVVAIESVFPTFIQADQDFCASPFQGMEMLVKVQSWKRIPATTR